MGMLTRNSKTRELVNCIMENRYTIDQRNYEYFFFEIDADEYDILQSIEVNLDVYSKTAKVVLNEYIEESPCFMTEGMAQTLTVLPDYLEKGENVIAYKGQIRITSIVLHKGNQLYPRQVAGHIKENDPYANAMEFLLNSQIEKPVTSRFVGSCYCIYDYTNQCFRMPCWLWSDAPTVSVMLDTIKSGRFPEYHSRMEQLARDICEVMMNTQILDKKEETYGAYVSRYRYYAHSDYSFNKLLGPNDTSFTVKWALLPMYEYTGEVKYLNSAELALDWVAQVSRTMPFVPSHYYFENKVWEDRAFVDTGFCVEGFQKYDAIVSGDKYSELIKLIMDRYIAQFRLENGFYGQNYIPGKGVDHNLFARGQAWALEGLLACVRGGINIAKYLKEAKSLADKLIKNQNMDGSWSWSLGDYEPDDETKAGSGSCEKATGVLAYMLVQLYLLDGKSEERYLLSANKAIKWCETHMMLDREEGYGGIASESIASGITGLPFLHTATGYANAFYLLAKGALEK